MRTVYTDRHRLRDPRTELEGGALIPPYEVPARVEEVLARVRAVGLGEVVDPDAQGLDTILRVHDAEYVRFLEGVWAEWAATDYPGEAIPTVWPAEHRPPRPPERLEGRLGYYALASETVISDGTWEAARAAADVALTARGWIAGGDRAAFALCRPPGHHAARALYGGYCFLNNAAIAAQAFLDDGASRVAILDVDFHHGNGTQSIFLDREDVLVLSLHGDPDHAFPYFWGRADETGTGAGEGWTGNYPLPPGTAWDRWSAALDAACGRIEAAAPDAVVVSLGLDTFKDDPISFFRLETEDYLRCGERLARLRLPTLFVMEGGYAVESLGVNTVNVLEGFEGA